MLAIFVYIFIFNRVIAWITAFVCKKRFGVDVQFERIGFFAYYSVTVRLDSSLQLVWHHALFFLKFLQQASFFFMLHLVQLTDCYFVKVGWKDRTETSQALVCIFLHLFITF